MTAGYLALPSQAQEPTAQLVDPVIAAHEARHAAVALLMGLEVQEARADNPTPEAAGYVKLAADSWRRPREHALMTLAGRWGDPDWPPTNPSKQGCTEDERQLADEVETIGRGRAGYEDLLVDVKRLVDRSDFKSVAGTLEPLLAAGCVLREDQSATGTRGVRQARARPQDDQGNRPHHRPGRVLCNRRGVHRRPGWRPDRPRRLREVDRGVA